MLAVKWGFPTSRPARPHSWRPLGVGKEIPLRMVGLGFHVKLLGMVGDLAYNL